MNLATKVNAISEKVISSCMGAYDMCSGEFINKTKPLLRQLEKESNTLDEFIDRLIDSQIFSVKVIFVRTKEQWDCTKEPLIIFLSRRTHWNFLNESFICYFERENRSQSDLSDVLFVQGDIDLKRKRVIKQWLLS